MTLDISITFASRLEHIPYGYRISPNGMYLGQGSLLIYELEMFWYGYHESHGGSTTSPGFDTRDEAVSWCVDSAQTSLKFWDTLVDHKQRGDRDTEGHQVIRCRNSHYIVYPPQTDVPSELAGYGGREWEFKMLADGRLIRSRNVWTQGMIPIDYRSKLPDNAVQLHQEDRLARYDPNSTPVG